jgi:hypothetical protein
MDSKPLRDVKPMQKASHKQMLSQFLKQAQGSEYFSKPEENASRIYRQS